MRLALLLLFLNVACQDINSNSGDASYGETIVVSDSDPNFAPAYTVLQNHCMRCHNVAPWNWQNLNSSEKWLETTWVTRGDPDNSQLITRLKNAGGDMPTDDTAIPQEDYEVLRTWISELPEVQ